MSKLKVWKLTNTVVGTDYYGAAGEVITATGAGSGQSWEWSHDIGVLGKKCFGNETISTSNPSGGVNGDIWYKY